MGTIILKMKVDNILLICFTILFLTSAKLESDKDVVGEAYSTTAKNDEQDVGAVSYGLASNLGHTLEDETTYKMPTMLQKLPDVQAPPKAGPLESAEEVATELQYYDGTQNINNINVNCSAFNADPTNCVKRDTCGWCGSTKNCIRGNAMSPMEKCPKKTYVFTAPNPAWNPLLNPVQPVNEFQVIQHVSPPTGKL